MSNLALTEAEANEIFQQVMTAEVAEDADVERSEILRNEILMMQKLMKREYQEALPFAMKFTELTMGHAKGWAALGAIFFHLGAYPEARRVLTVALAIEPTHPDALANMAAVEQSSGQFARSIQVYEELIAKEPNNNQLKWEASLAYLSKGELVKGFQYYRSRLQVDPGQKNFYTTFPLPFWQGEAISDKHVLVWTEQGVGDELLISTMVPDIIARAKQVTFMCGPRLVPLFQRSFPTARVISRTGNYMEETKDCQVQASLSELGEYLRPNFAAFPKSPQVLLPDFTKIQAYRKEFKALAQGRKIVGVAWESLHPKAKDDKTIPLLAWGPVLKAQEDMCLISINPGREEGSEYGIHVLDSIQPMAQNLDDYAAACAALDRAFCVSSSAAHMCAAVGTRTGIFVPATRARLWYWHAGWDKSPWYKNATLLRQTRVGDWRDPMLEAAFSPNGETIILHI